MLNQHQNKEQETILVRVDFPGTTKRFNALELEQKHAEDLQKSLNIPITVSVELEFNCYLHTVNYGEAVLGIYSKNSETGLWEAYPIYNNPLDLKTYHETSTEARSAIVSAYLKHSVTLSTVPKVRYLVSLCTEEIDEYGAPWGHNEIVELGHDVQINWHLWLIRYSEQLGEDLCLLEVKKLENNALTEF